jgi:hypothetical protein
LEDIQECVFGRTAPPIHDRHHEVEDQR